MRHRPGGRSSAAGGVTGARAVAGLVAHGGLHMMVDLGLSDRSTITATDQHPFWKVRSRHYGGAINLRPGAQVRGGR